MFAILIASVIGIFYEPQNLTDKSMSDRFIPILYLLIGGMLLPLFEETLFRLSLVFKPIYLALSAACFGYYLSTKIIFNSRLTLIDDTFLYRIGISILLGSLMLIILSNQQLKNRLRSVWTNKFHVIYYTSAIVFAWLHLLNFELNYTNILLTPILTLPQLFSGLVTGYLRVKFGFLYPLLFHVFTNSILIGLSILVG
ncbi:CPBP family glutamic-type intramembrane protease [Gynurincola endophyticus]|uniref:CPBP family glutamic-type intramembrane protease n=1 Tax=Gynurincola endophyticus TaxID=2479004 RepID=UPI0013152977|nr:CPBP family glutamic-type intramembrane protease [Gynurincola endophyticus]